MEQILGNRYEIIEQIGGGGMAVVYLAKDLFLDRLVAVKLLKDEFVDDQDFVRRFHKEAKAVASLSHQNIVNIYDFGESSHSSYLVMEYIEGKTLKQIINEQGPLSSEQVIDIGLQICEGIAQAHARQIIHKDIKPHNILIDKNGVVKVTDFGIAQAVNNMTITHNKGILGSAHYFSPEQAKGEVVDFRSDLYSLGVVLYEMATGQVPFTGENPVTVALKHIQNQPRPISELGVDIPPRLEWVIMKALEKNPLDRFASATEMAEELADILHSPQGSKSKEYGKMRKPYFEKNSVLEDKVAVKKMGDITRILHEDFLSDVILPTSEQGKVVSEEPMKKEAKQASGRSVKLANLLVMVLIAAGLLVGGFWGAQKLLAKGEVSVPDITTLPILEAQKILINEDLALKIVDTIYDDVIPEDAVISQDPLAESKVKAGREIEVVVSKGSDQVVVPNLQGMNKRDAVLALENKGLTLGETGGSYSDKYKVDEVIIQSPQADTKVSKDTAVSLTLSLGAKPQMVTMPTLDGIDLEEAKKTIRSSGLEVGTVTQEESVTHYPNTVITQSPVAKGQTLQGTTVDLVVSTGPGPQTEKTSSVQWVIPEQSLVVVEVVDEAGTKIVYKEECEANAYLNQSFTYQGVGKVNIYCNNELKKTFDLL